METKKNIFKAIADFPYYEISNDGLVRSVNRFVESGGLKKRLVESKIIKPFITNSGYKQVNLTNQHKKFYIHRLVASNFIRKIKVNEEVNHKDGNKLNNNLSNLEVITESENKKHAYRVLGRKVWNIKLTKEKANEIREKYKQGKFSQHKLAPIYGVSVMVINRIINNVQQEYK